MHELRRENGACTKTTTIRNPFDSNQFCRQPALQLGDAQRSSFPARIASLLSQRHLARPGNHLR